MFVQTLECFPETYAERRRAARRHPAHNTVCRLTTLDGRVVGTGLVWNLSVTGVSMLLNVALQPGDFLDAELRNGRGDSLGLSLRVVHFTTLRTGDFILGAQFDRTLGEDELRPFVA
jgi:hypothetical protein